MSVVVMCVGCYLSVRSSRVFPCGTGVSAQVCVCRTARGRASAADRMAGCRDSTSTKDTPLHQHAERSGNRSRVSLRALLPADTGELWVCFGFWLLWLSAVCVSPEEPPDSRSYMRETVWICSGPERAASVYIPHGCRDTQH